MFTRLMRMSFYAVRVGRTPGIYRDWNSCKQQVDGFSGARYKKFKTATDAEGFINEVTLKPRKDEADVEEVAPIQSIYDASKLPFEALPLGQKLKKKKKSLGVKEKLLSKRSKKESTEASPLVQKLKKRSLNGKNEPSPKRLKKEQKSAAGSENAENGSSINEPVDVYTDGACVHNGRPNAKAAIGVFWGVDHHMNVSERLPGRQTNNRAEIHAARKAIEQAKAMGRTNVRLFTDSQFLINAITKWVKKWQKNGWKLINGKPVINKEDFEQLKESSRGMNITWIKVAGHNGVFGNEWADKLAVAGLDKPLPDR